MVKSEILKKCEGNGSKFCFVCTEYIKGSLRKKSKFTAKFQEKYKTVFGVDRIKNLNKPYSGSSICRRCRDGFNKLKNNNNFYLKKPAVWCSIGKKHVAKRCFVCSINFDDQRKFNGKRILNVEMPLERSSIKKAPKRIDQQDSDDDDHMYVSSSEDAEEDVEAEEENAEADDEQDE